MVQCSAPGCNHSSTTGYLLKRFPRDPERRAKWANNIQKTNWEPTDNSYVCEVHFEDDQWESKRVDRLKWNAVPTIFDKRLKYTKRRKEQEMPQLPIAIKPDISRSLNEEQSEDQIVYVLEMDDYITDNNDDLNTNMEESSDDVKCEDEMFEYYDEIEDDSKKDEIIEELKKQIAEKDRCLLKYEKIICQMNSHLEKLKGRLKFWRDFSERDKFSLRKVRKMNKSFAV